MRAVAHGEQVHVDAVGRTTVDDAEAMTTDAIFRISSMTKPVTAVAALSCIKDGLFRLDEPVDRLLPELADRTVLEHEDTPLGWVVPANRPILVRDLLTFTLGLGIVMAPPGEIPLADALVELELGQGPPSPQGPPPPDEWIRRLGTLPLLHQPGERWLYGTGSDVLGVLLARAANAPLEEVLRRRVFDPLGMGDTAFWTRPQDHHRLVPAYATDPPPASWRSTTLPPGRGAVHRASPPVRPGWCPPRPTWWPSGGCCWPAASGPPAAG